MLIFFLPQKPFGEIGRGWLARVTRVMEPVSVVAITRNKCRAFSSQSLETQSLTFPLLHLMRASTSYMHRIKTELSLICTSFNVFKKIYNLI